MVRYISGRSLQLASVEKVEKFLKDGRLDIFDDDLLRPWFDHVGFEHGGEDGTAGGDDALVGRKDPVSEVELEIGEERLFGRRPELAAHQSVDGLVAVVIHRLDDVDVEIVGRQDVGVRVAVEDEGEHLNGRLVGLGPQRHLLAVNAGRDQVNVRDFEAGLARVDVDEV